MTTVKDAMAAIFSRATLEEIEALKDAATNSWHKAENPREFWTAQSKEPLVSNADMVELINSAHFSHWTSQRR